MKISQYFTRAEFACHCGCGFDTADHVLVRYLETIRAHFGSPIAINSAARCIKHNRSIGSKDTSQHVIGRAADITIKGISPEEVAAYADSIMPEGGIGIYRTFTHIDSRDARARWDQT